MNLASFSRSATWRTRSSALFAWVRLRVRGAFCRSMLPLAGRLPSTVSAPWGPFRCRPALGYGRGFPLRARVGFALASRPSVRHRVRRLRRYYASVRLLTTVRHRLRLCLPDAARHAIPYGRSERSPGSRTWSFPCMRRVWDRAGPSRHSRWRTWSCCLPSPLPRRRPEGMISRLVTSPVRAPVNASSVPSRAPTHDSGPP